MVETVKRLWRKPRSSVYVHMGGGEGVEIPMTIKQAKRTFERGIRTRTLLPMTCTDGRFLYLNPMQMVCIMEV